MTLNIDNECLASGNRSPLPEGTLLDYSNLLYRIVFLLASERSDSYVVNFFFTAIWVLAIKLVQLLLDDYL